MPLFGLLESQIHPLRTPAHFGAEAGFTPNEKCNLKQVHDSRLCVRLEYVFLSLAATMFDVPVNAARSELHATIFPAAKLAAVVKLR